jgi:hypothetical protein
LPPALAAYIIDACGDVALPAAVLDKADAVQSKIPFATLAYSTLSDEACDAIVFGEDKCVSSITEES